MYCTTCELEIMGDDKDTCPVCGGPLIDSPADDSALINQSQQEQPASEEIFKDTASSEVPDLETSPAGTAEEEAFELKDYDSDFAGTDGLSSSSDASEDSQLFEQPDMQQDVDAQPLMTGSVQGVGSMDDVLDSIRESISTSDSRNEEPPAAGGESVSLDEDFACFDSFDMDSSAEIPSEKTADESAQISWGYDEAADAVAMPDALERKRSPVVMIALIVVLFVAGGYYLFTATSDDEQSLVRETSETVVTAEPVFEDDVEIIEPSSEAELIVASEEAASVVSAEVVVSDEGGAAKPSAETQPEVPVASEEAESLVSAESVVSGEGGAAKPSVETQPEAPVASEEAESVVSAEAVVPGEGEAAKPSMEAQPEVPVASKEAESVVSAEAAVSGEAEAAKPSAETQLAVPVASKPVTAPFFTVHVGSYRKRASAASEVARIKAKGYDAFIERVDLGKKGLWYRVKVGRFKNRAEAEQLQEKIKKIPVTDSMVVTQRTN